MQSAVHSPSSSAPIQIRVSQPIEERIASASCLGGLIFVARLQHSVEDAFLGFNKHGYRNTFGSGYSDGFYTSGSMPLPFRIMRVHACLCCRHDATRQYI